MKKIILVSVTFFILFTLCSCRNQDTVLTNNSSNKTTTSNYENPYMMEQLKEAFYNGDYALVEEKANEIIKQYPDTVDAIMAESYIELLNQKNVEKEQEYADVDFKDYIQLIDASIDKSEYSSAIDLYIRWKNTSSNTVKYAYFTCDLYNAVDDRVSCEITRKYSFTGKVTGPIESGTVYGNDTYWENAWWNNSGKYVKITNITLEYMDGTKIEIPESKIDDLWKN